VGLGVDDLHGSGQAFVGDSEVVALVLGRYNTTRPNPLPFLPILGHMHSTNSGGVHMLTSVDLG